MINIQINCEPEDYEAHFALLGFMRKPPFESPPYTPPETDAPQDAVKSMPKSEEQSERRKPGRPKRQEQPAAEAAQDAADEKAESDKNKPAELTHNDVREAISRYSKKHGAQAAVANIRAILGSSIEGVAATQENLAAAIAKIDAAAAAPLPKPKQEEKDEALFGLDASKTTTEEEEPRAAKKEVNEAARLYGVKYDGTTDPKQMVHTAPDVRAILSEALNMKVIDFNSFPDEPLICGRAKAAIMKAIEENPFKREIKG